MTRRQREERLRDKQHGRAIDLHLCIERHPEWNRDQQITAIRDWLSREYRLGRTAGRREER